MKQSYWILETIMFKKIGAGIINSMMVVLLLGLLIAPLGTLGLAGIKPTPSASEVLSVQDSKLTPEEKITECMQYCGFCPQNVQTVEPSYITTPTNAEFLNPPLAPQ